jgi:hypothetical protein
MGLLASAAIIRIAKRRYGSGFRIAALPFWIVKSQRAALQQSSPYGRTVFCIVKIGRKSLIFNA